MHSRGGWVRLNSARLAVNMDVCSRSSAFLLAEFALDFTRATSRHSRQAASGFQHGRTPHR